MRVWKSLTTDAVFHSHFLMSLMHTVFPSSHISVLSHTNIPNTVAETSLNHFACQVVTVQRAYMGLALYKRIHMDLWISCHYQPIHYLFYGPSKESDETIPESCQSCQHYPQISNVCYMFFTELRGAQPQSGTTACCALKHLTSSRDLAAIWDISSLIPADWYKQMLNVRLKLSCSSGQTVWR